MLDLKEEQRYNRLRKLAQELHIPIPEAFITLEVFDKNGRLLQRHRQRSHSWTRNAYNALFSVLAGKNLDDATFGAGLLSLKDTAAAVTYSNNPYGFSTSSVDTPGDRACYQALATNDDSGILVGSGTNAESFEDYALQTQIVEGTGAGQLNHVQSEAHSISYAALVLKNELVRYLNNNSGGNVDVNEVALVSHCYYPGSQPKIVISRDKLASTVTIPDTGQLKVTYTVQLTYPA